MRAGAAAGPGRSSPDAHREVCDGLTPINLASCARENTFARYRTRCSDKGSSAATRPVRAAPRTAAFLVGAFFAGALTASFFDALLATPVLFVGISPPYPIFFVGCNVTSSTGFRCRQGSLVARSDRIERSGTTLSTPERCRTNFAVQEGAQGIPCSPPDHTLCFIGSPPKVSPHAGGVAGRYGAHNSRWSLNASSSCCISTTETRPTRPSRRSVATDLICST